MRCISISGNQLSPRKIPLLSHLLHREQLLPGRQKAFLYPMYSRDGHERVFHPGWQRSVQGHCMTVCRPDPHSLKDYCSGKAVCNTPLQRRSFQILYLNFQMQTGILQRIIQLIRKFRVFCKASSLLYFQADASINADRIYISLNERVRMLISTFYHISVD